jgi:hypothetical protein
MVVGVSPMPNPQAGGPPPPPRLLSAAAYSLYLQLLSIAGVHFLHLQPEDAP